MPVVISDLLCFPDVCALIAFPMVPSICVKCLTLTWRDVKYALNKGKDEKTRSKVLLYGALDNSSGNRK